MPRVRITPIALRELEKILEGLAEQSPKLANQVGRALLRWIDLLESNPRLGRLISSTPEEYRQIVVREVIVRYRLAASGSVDILSIRHGRQRQPSVSDLQQRVEENQG